MKSRKVLALLLVMTLMAGILASCRVAETIPTQNEETAMELPPRVERERRTDKNVLYGVGEPLVQTGVTDEKGSAEFEAAEYLLDAMNFGAIREWMHLTDILKSPTEVNVSRAKQYTDALEMYWDLGLEITGMSHQWFIVGSNGKPQAVNGRMYRRDTSEGSLYMQSLAAIEQAWKTMAETFPQVDQWEVGNEWNTSDFLNVYPESSTPFTDEERMQVATDMMYYAYRGIKAGNPYAQVVSFAPAIGMPSFTGTDGAERMIPFTNPGYGIALALSRVYANITSGQFPAGLPADTDPDHYFDVVAWHPYMFTGMNPQIVSEVYPGLGRFYREEHIDALWQNINDMAYNVMVMNGDADKKVVFTEVGFNDMHNADKEAEYLEEYEKLFTMVSETMPYVKTVYVFRLLTASGLGGQQEYQFGMFWKDMENYNSWLKRGEYAGQIEPYSEIYPDFTPRDKAYTLQKITGGTKELELPEELRERLK